MSLKIERRALHTPEQDVKGILQRTVQEGVSLDEQERRKSDNAQELNEATRNLGKQLLNTAETSERDMPASNENSEVIKEGIETFVNKIVEQQYDAAINGLPKVDHVKSEDAPTETQAKECLVAYLQKNPSDFEILKRCNEPMLVFGPPIKASETIASIDENKTGGIKENTWISSEGHQFVRRADAANNIKWQIGIMEGAEDAPVLAGEDITDLHKNRMDYAQERDIQPLNIHWWLLSQNHRNRNGQKPMDNIQAPDGTVTLLERHDNLVAVGYFRGNRVQLRLSDFPVAYVLYSARFRPLVVVDVD